LETVACGFVFCVGIHEDGWVLDRMGLDWIGCERWKGMDVVRLGGIFWEWDGMRWEVSSAADCEVSNRCFFVFLFSRKVEMVA